MNRAQRRMNQAVTRHQSPLKQAIAFHRSGLEFANAQQWQKAIEYLQKATELNPLEPIFWNNLSAAFCRADRLAEAVESARKAGSLDPSYVEAKFNLATALKKSGDLQGAITQYQIVLTKRPSDLDALINLAGCYAAIGDIDAAEICYAEALALAPNEPLLLANRGALSYQQGRLEEAAIYLRRSLARETYGAHYNYGLVCYRQGWLEEARMHLTKAVNLNPASAEGFSSLSALLLLMGKAEDALMAAQNAYRLAPLHLPVLNNLAACLDENDQPQEAMELCRRVMDLAPADPGGLVNMAILLRRQHRWSEVVQLLKKAIAVEPDDPVPHFYLCGTHFLMGDWKEAWQEFRWRWHKVGERPRAKFSRPRWEGEDLTGKTILAWGEQGIGDEIMFAGLLPDLADKAMQVRVECESRLVPLFKRSFPWAEIRAHPQDEHGPAMDRSAAQDFDYEAAFGDLSEFFRGEATAFPQRKCYLQVDQEKTDLLRQRYKSIAGERKIIGISWRSGNLRSGPRRSASLSLWSKILQRSDCFFVSLQYGDVSEAAAYPSLYVDSNVDAKEDMDLFAAQVAAMDLVISIDNTTIHMAGALGKEVWALLSYHADVRWGLEAEDTPWYPSMHLIRQEKSEDWTPVIDRVVERLKSYPT